MVKVSENSFTVESQTLDSVLSYWQQNGKTIPWRCLFVLPGWLNAWWKCFKQSFDLYILSVCHNGQAIGIAPLRRKGDTARLIGDKSVCDNLDFIVAPEKTTEFFDILINHLRQDGVEKLVLEPVRSDSSIFTTLLPAAEKVGCKISYECDDMSFEMKLPDSWDAYLAMLSGKERHEIRRKLRRLSEAGHVTFRMVEEYGSVQKEMETFFALFVSNRPDKAAFMTDRMNVFFRYLTEALTEVRICKLFFLELDGRAIAAAMCFDYRSTMYLYNNGYDKQFSSLSVGVLSKVLSIKNSIQTGKHTYDFLKGTEGYKQRLGGKPVQLYRCFVELT
jgi:CelD/BcsL family acetyltransferase involved in cellulose biosynthesis